MTLNLKNGYNTVYLQGVQVPAATDTILKKDVTIFDYNWKGDKKWRSTAAGDRIVMLLPGLGSYIYNPGPDTTVQLYAPVAPTENKTVIKRGWNLLSNENEAKLADLKVNVVKKEEKNACNSLTCSEQKTLKDLFEGKPSVRRAYGKIYQIIDSNATTADKAFKIIEITESNLSEVKVPAGVYWLYLFE